MVPRSIGPEHDRGRGSGIVNSKGTVASCRECNALLGDNLFLTVETRAAYLLGVYQSRYRKLLAMPEWQKDELRDLGRTLRSSIETSLRERDNVRARILALEVVSYGA